MEEMRKNEWEEESVCRMKYRWERVRGASQLCSPQLYFWDLRIYGVLTCIIKFN